MRLLYVINGLGTGGAERSLSEMLPLLTEAGIDVTIAILVAGRDGVEADVLRSRFDVRHVGEGSTPARVRALRALIRRERPDLIQTTHFESDVCGRLAAAGSGIPVLTSLVNTPYDPVRADDPSVPRWKLRAARAIDTITARFLTEHFHAISHAVKASAVERMGIRPERITVVERGRDERRLGSAGRDRRRRVRRSLGIARNAEVVLNVGRREFQKGQRWLIEGVDALADERPDLVLLIAGRDGSASAELHSIRTRSRHPDRIRFLGHRADVPDLLAAADVFAFPSLYEGLGCSVVEAMALRVPVVASEVPALREVVEDGVSGILVPPASTDALTAALRKLLDDPTLRGSMGDRGRLIFERRYRLERIAARTIDLYRSLVSPGGSKQ